MGRGLHLTIDEWFYHWFADAEKLTQASTFFFNLFEVCDKIVIQKGTRLADKFYNLVNSSSMYPPKERLAVKSLMNLFITNSNKVFWVDDVEELSQEIIPQLPRKDLYLVQICIQTTDKICVTSDTTLHQNLLDTYPILGIKTYMVEDFMRLYPDI